MARTVIRVNDELLKLIDVKAAEETRTRSQQINHILKEWKRRQSVGWVNTHSVSYDLILVSSGGKKIQCIKNVRSLTNQGLKESKDVIDLADAGVPQVVTSYSDIDQARHARHLLEGDGAIADITEAKS